MQKFRGILMAVVIAAGVAAFATVWLHAVPEVALAIAAIVGVAIALVVGTRTDAHDEAADAAWRLAAPGLPPGSDRAALELGQRSMPGPERPTPVASSPEGSPAADLQDPGVNI